MDPNNAPVKAKKILIVEDDFFVRDLYTLQARQAGLEVVTAKDGLEAVSKAEAELPDFILMDLMLPGQDGLSAIKEIKENPMLANIPFAIVTNLEDSIKEQEAKSAGATDYLLKIKNTPKMIITNITNFIH